METKRKHIFFQIHFIKSMRYFLLMSYSWLITYLFFEDDKKCFKTCLKIFHDKKFIRWSMLNSLTEFLSTYRAIYKREMKFSKIRLNLDSQCQYDSKYFNSCFRSKFREFDLWSFYYCIAFSFSLSSVYAI